MTHIGQKDALGLIGGFGYAPGLDKLLRLLLEFALGPLALGDLFA